MTAALISLAVVVAGALAAVIVLALAFRRALDDRTVAVEDRILAVAARDAAEGRAAQLESERDGALSLAQALQADAARAREELIRHVSTAAASADPAALSALVDGLLVGPAAVPGPAGAGGDGDAAAGAVRPAADAPGPGAGAGAGRRALRG